MKSCIIIGGGSSVKEGLTLDLWNQIKGQDIWSVNFAFMTMPYFPSKEIWVDKTFFTNNIDKLQELSVNGVDCIAKEHGVYNEIKAIKQVACTRDEYNTDIKKPLFIGSSGLSGVFALSYAISQGYDTIYLLGYDFGTKSLSDNKTHYYLDTIAVSSHGLHCPEVYLDDNGPKKEVREFDYFLKENCKIYNVSPQSNIQSFDKIDYPTFFNYLKQDKLFNLIENS